MSASALQRTERPVPFLGGPARSRAIALVTATVLAAVPGPAFPLGLLQLLQMPLEQLLRLEFTPRAAAGASLRATGAPAPVRPHAGNRP